MFSVVVVVVTSGSVTSLGHVHPSVVGGHVGVQVVDGGAVAVDGVGGGEAQVGPLQVIAGHGILPGVLGDGGHYLGVEGNSEGRPHSILVGVGVGGPATALGGDFIGDCGSYQDH